MNRKAPTSTVPSRDGSPLPRIAGAAMLLEVLGEERSAWVTEFLVSTQGPVLASDEAFLRWLDEERQRDPHLVEKVRHVLSVHRDEVFRHLSQESDEDLDG